MWGRVFYLTFRRKGWISKINHMDCGMTIFDQNMQDTHAGGSGCGCAAIILAAYILPKISRGEWKRVSSLYQRGRLCRPSVTMKEKVFRESHMELCWNIVKGGKDYGLYQCILGRRTDLCSGADTAGQDETDAGRVMVLLVCSGSVLGY